MIVFRSMAGRVECKVGSVRSCSGGLASIGRCEVCLSLLRCYYSAGSLAWDFSIGAPRRVDWAIGLRLVCLPCWQIAGSCFKIAGGKKDLSRRVMRRCLGGSFCASVVEPFLSRALNLHDFSWRRSLAPRAIIAEGRFNRDVPGTTLRRVKTWKRYGKHKLGMSALCWPVQKISSYRTSPLKSPSKSPSVLPILHQIVPYNEEAHAVFRLYFTTCFRI